MAKGFDRNWKKNTVLFAHSQRGAAHILNDTVCQDSALAASGSDFLFAAVCDGHGGRDYFRSDRGSRFAAQAAKECAADRNLLAALRESSARQTDILLMQLKRSIIGRWSQLVWEDFESNGFSDCELDGISDEALKCIEQHHIEFAYGSTMLFALAAKDFRLIMQIGDGTCAELNDSGEFICPLPKDERCCMNVTTSLCDDDALNELHHSFERAVPAAIFLSTDGAENSFADTESLYGFFRTAAAAFASDDAAEAESQLCDYLPRLSEKGSGDDISVAFILNRPQTAALLEKSE